MVNSISDHQPEQTRVSLVVISEFLIRILLETQVSRSQSYSYIQYWTSIAVKIFRVIVLFVILGACLNDHGLCWSIVIFDQSGYPTTSIL